MRPVLAPAARRVWRGSSTLQLCLSPQHGVLVEGLEPTTRLVLPLLDGVRTREQVLADARAAGCADPGAVLDALEATGLLIDADALQVPSPDREERHRLGPDLAALSLSHGSAAADALQARREACVVVHGAGRVGGPLAALLSEAGVGTVELRDEGTARWEDTAVGGIRPHDVGRRRGPTLNHRLRSADADVEPSLLVLTEDVDDQLSRVLVRAGVPHLVARTDALLGTVGPLVLPGQSPCLRCLDLVRAAVDPDWPHLFACDEQGPRPVEAGHGVLASAVASQAALQVLELIEGGTPASVAGTLELALPGWRWRRRTWPAHPGCDCDAAGARRVA